MSNIRIDNVDYEVSDVVIAHINALAHRCDAAEAKVEVQEQEMKKKDEAVEAKKSELDQKKADMAQMKKDLKSCNEKIDELFKEKEGLKGQLEAAKAERDDLIAKAKEEGAKEAEEKAEVEETAEKVGVSEEEKKAAAQEEAPKEGEAPKKDRKDSADISNQTLKKLIVGKVYPTIKLDGKSAEFIDGMYKSVRENMRNDSVLVKKQGEQIVGVTASQRQDSDDKYQTAAQRRLAMIERQRNAYKSQDDKF